MLPIVLRGGGAAEECMALVDSGADVNVLPWSVGLRLGLVWNPNKATLRIAGVPSGATAMPVVLTADFGEFTGITQAFAWCDSDHVPLVLGQTNFFMEFDICFFNSRKEFQVMRKAS
jgi:hypothetical protein